MNHCRISTSCILMVCLTFLCAAAGGAPRGKLELKLASPQPAGAPIVLELLITSVGTEPIHYWTGGPGTYPSAHLMTVQATDANGEVWLFRLGNGQYIAGSGHNVDFSGTRRMPGVFGPLPPGEYTLEISGKSEGPIQDGVEVVRWPAMSLAAPVRLSVVDDPARRREIEDQFRVDGTTTDQRRGDPFARYVAHTYGLSDDSKLQLSELLEDDVKAMSAIGALQHLRRLPPDGEQTLQKAIQMRFGQTGKEHETIMHYLALIAANVGTEGALEAELVMARSPNEDERAFAVRNLDRFREKQAIVALLGYLNDPGLPVRKAAVDALGFRSHPSALEPLLARLTSANDEDRRSSAFLLSRFNDRPEVRSALEALTKDSSPSVRREAETSLKERPSPYAWQIGG